MFQALRFELGDNEEFNVVTSVFESKADAWHILERRREYFTRLTGQQEV
jgi:hypothetical protein